LQKTTKKGGGVASKEDVLHIAESAAAAGLEALNGQPGAAFDSLLYAGAIAWQHLQADMTLVDAADIVREAILSGSALERFQNA
jgi:anthranilate phosphoribosyltransferase